MMSEKRIKRLRRSLLARDLDTALIFGPENRFYLSGFWAEDLGCTESSGCLLITRDENLLLTDGRYEEQASREAKGFRVLIYKTGLKGLLRRIFKELEIKRCGLEENYISYFRAKSIKKAFPEIKWVELGPIVEKMRSVKEQEEIEKIRASQRVNEEVFEEVLSNIKIGMSEKELSFMIFKGLMEKADGPSFPPIVASGPNSSLPHAVPTERRIKEHEPIIIDMGARLNGYCSDMTRTVFLGEPGEEFKKIYNVVKDAQKRAKERIRAGITAREADSFSRDFITEKGLGKYFLHSLGHGVGIAIHEAPALSKRSRKNLKIGMVITIEPGIYLPGKGGVRLEDMAVVKEDGVDVITSNKWFYEF